MKRCPNGTRRNKQTSLCESVKKEKESPKKRCPKGTRRNKNTGLCESNVVPVKTPSPIVHKREVVIMVGFPASGKTTYAKELEREGNHVRIDGDSLKTGPRMVKEAEKYVDTKSIIFDATNGTRERRQLYIDFAKKHDMHVRCLWKNTSMEKSMEQNRARYAQGGPKIPDIVYYTYRKRFEAPSQGECEVVMI